jgi:hypothetical protein
MLGNEPPYLDSDTVSSPRLTWTEAGRGTVRVQWSHDLLSWWESGDEVDGVTRTVTVTAAGPQRQATLSSSTNEASPVFLRLVVTAVELSNDDTFPAAP